MAKAFDFEEFKALKISDYKSSYCKIANLKKAKGALFLTEYSLTTATVKCIMIPFKKYAEATKAYKQLKSDKEHPLNKVALATIVVDTEGQENCLKVELKAGNLTAEKLLNKSKVFTKKLVKMNLEVITGTPEEEESTDTTATSTAEENDPSVAATGSEEGTDAETPTITPKERAVHHKRLKDLTTFFDKLSNMS